MAYKTIVEDGIDILVVGAGLGGTGAAWEARFWGQDKKIVIAEKANIDRSGAVAQGLYAINCYMGTRWGENKPEDHVRYARIDLMGLVREDLLFDMARHVDSTVHQFEEWGLPIMKDPKTGRYLREGRWQIMIHGESYKPIVAEAARKSADKIFNRICVTHLLMDDGKENRVAGAVGFNVRTGDYHVFKAKTVICGAGGASNIFKPRSVGEGSGRTWYAPWSSASAYGLMIDAGAKMTQMENRIVLARFKDGYGPVGAYFLHLKTYTQNCLGEEYESKWFPALQQMVGKEYLDPEASHLTHRPIPTCLRNHCIISEVNAGRGPIHMVTMKAFQDPHLEEVGWENFLGMTIGQAVLWAATDVDPKNENPELTTSEPYVMGSHATGSGAWCSGPEDVSPPEYFWGYNRMTTIEGLFGAGDAVGGTPHAFSSGSFTEGRLQVHRRRQGRRHRRVRGTDRAPQAGDLQAPGALPDLPQCGRGGHRQSALHQSPAGPGPPAEADGRVLRRRDGQLHDQREAPQYRAEEAQDHGGRPREPGGEGHSRAAARVGTEAPPSRRGVRHAAHAVSQGDPLAGLLLPGRRHEGGRRELARAHRLAPRSANRRIHHGEGALLSPGLGQGVAALPGRKLVNIIEKTDEELLAIAEPLWRDLIKNSNEGKYGEFARNFSSSLALAIDQVVAGHQFANSELARNLSEDFDALGIIRRGEHVTVLYRQRSTKKPGEWLGRLVLGYEDGQVRIFGASIF
jgi:adenylylsulfate reductase subunit A